MTIGEKLRALATSADKGMTGPALKWRIIYLLDELDEAEGRGISRIDPPRDRPVKLYLEAAE